MPYYISSAGIDGPMKWRFEPEFPIENYRAFVKGGGLSDSDIERFPKKIIVDNLTDPKELPEVIASFAMIGVVNKEVKEYLEQNDPGLYKFFPLLVQITGSNFLAEYFFLYSENKISSICYQETRFLHGYGLEAAKKSLFIPLKEHTGDAKCVLYKKDSIKGSIWRSPDDENPFIFFCSDAFGDFIKRQNIRGWELTACQWQE